MTDRYETTIAHGEAGTVYSVVDTTQPEAEQPCVVQSWNTRTDPNAQYLARDFCIRHNAKHRIL